MGNKQEVLRQLGAAFFLASPTGETISEVQHRSASFPVQVLAYSRLEPTGLKEIPAFVTKLKKKGQGQSLEAYLYGFYFSTESHFANSLGFYMENSKPSRHS